MERAVRQLLHSVDRRSNDGSCPVIEHDRAEWTATFTQHIFAREIDSKLHPFIVGAIALLSTCERCDPLRQVDDEALRLAHVSRDAERATISAWCC